MRPRTLAEVAQLAACGDSFDRCLANFLDEFYSAPGAEALAGAANKREEILEELTEQLSKLNGE